MKRTFCTKAFVYQAALLLPLVGIAQQVATARPVGGDKIGFHRVEAHATDRFVVACYGREVTRVEVGGDGDTDLDLYVYDENGNLITSDTDLTDHCIVSFTPRWTGTFTIRVVNRGSVYNNYRIAVS